MFVADNNSFLKRILFVFCVGYIILFCWLGIYAYPISDDYNYACFVSEQPFWALQPWLYSHLNGRLFNTFLICLVSLLPLQPFYWLFPMVTIISYTAGFCFFLRTIRPNVLIVEDIFLALLGTSCTLAVLPYLNETLFWRAGMPYFWTTTFLVLIFSLAVRAFRGEKNAFWLCLLLTFLNGTILELPCVFQGIAAFFAALYFLNRRERKKTLMSGAFWIVSVMAFLVIYLSPGTAARMGELATIPTLSHLIRTLSVASAFGAFTVVKFFIKPVVWIFLLFLPVIADKVPAFDENLASRVRAWHIVLTTSLIAPLMQAIGGWAEGSGLALRGESLGIWMMGAVWASLWSFGYRQERGLEKIRFSRMFAWRWWLLLLSLAVSFNFMDLIGDLKTAHRFAAENKARDEQIRQEKDAGKQNIVLPRLESRPKLLFVNDLRPWSSWVNNAFAKYYSVEIVSVLPGPLCCDADALIRLRNGDPEPLEKFAEQGDGELQFLIGEMYDPFFEGMEGVNKNLEKSKWWYIKAANAGNAQACRRLTRLYFLYDTSPQKYLKAAYWFMRSELALLRL